MDHNILRQFADRVARNFVPHEEHQLRRREIHLLMLIDRNPQRPLRYYARLVGLERGSFTYLAEVMEHRGYIIRKEDEKDKRRKTLELTEQGQAVVMEAKKEMDKHLDRIFVDFTEQEKEELAKAVATIERLLPKLPESPRRHDRHHRPPHPHHPERPHRHDE